MLADIIKQFELLAKEKEIALSLKLPEKLPHVMLDIHLMSRVFQNLLDNAIKYTPRHGYIEVDARIHNLKVNVSVFNSGDGISSEDIPHLFDRYFKVDHTQNTNSTGLGLAITKKIIDLHDAEIIVASVLGESTTFEVQLPYAA